MQLIKITLIAFLCLLLFTSQAQTLEESGINKKVLKEGKGVSPKKGETVKIKFEGKLENGELFEANSFKFEIGDPDMIPGWNIALPTMKIGEKSEFLLPPAMGYGATGVKDEDGEVIIPGNATLIFEIELQGIK